MKNKRFLTFLLIFAFCLSGFSVAAEQFFNDAVVDGGDFLTDEEECLLGERLSGLREELGFDIAVFTEMSPEGYEPRTRAESIYDTMHYGSGEEKRGIILYFNRERDYFLVKGTTTDEISDTELSILDGEVLEKLSGGLYFDACLVFGETAAEFASNVVDPLYNGEYSDGYYDDEYYEDYEDAEMSIFSKIVIFIILIPLIVAFVITLFKQLKMNTARKTDDAHVYAGNDSFGLSVSKDIFLYSTVTKTPKPKPQNSTRPGSGMSRGGSIGRSSGGKF